MSLQARVELRLLDGFELQVDGDGVPLALSTRRLLAFLALHGQPLTRSHVAASLWPDGSDPRAAANLRSALWRLPDDAPALVASRAQVELAPRVRVDLDDALDLFRTLVAGTGVPLGASVPALLLRRELLPGWYDEWVAVERERHRQLRLHALEAACRLHAAAGHFAAAVEAGVEAVATEPLRESAHRALIGAHLAEGNVGEARRQYEACRAQLAAELGVEPSEPLRALARQGGFAPR